MVFYYCNRRLKEPPQPKYILLSCLIIFPCAFAPLRDSIRALRVLRGEILSFDGLYFHLQILLAMSDPPLAVLTSAEVHRVQLRSFSDGIVS